VDDRPHIDWPIQVTGTAYATCQQDTDQDAAAAIAVLCSFERGTRSEQPDFGITDPAFQLVPVDVTEIERQAAIYEPRAELTITLSEPTVGEQQVRIAVRVATAEET
jgi:hypothetical protein